MSMKIRQLVGFGIASFAALGAAAMPTKAE